MKLLNIDISQYKSNHVDEYSKIDFDYVFTVCDNAKQICPVFPNLAIQYIKVLLIQQMQKVVKRRRY